MIEKDTVEEGKLNLGYGFGSDYGKEDQYGVVVLNSMFGGDGS